MKIFRTIVMVLVTTLLSIGSARSQVATHGIDTGWQWTGTGTACYSVYRATIAGAEAKPPIASCITGYITGCFFTAANGYVACYTDATAAVGTKYFYTVTATVGGVESAPSSEVSALITVPNSPTNPATAVH